MVALGYKVSLGSTDLNVTVTSYIRLRQATKSYKDYMHIQGYKGYVKATHGYMIWIHGA